MARPKTVLQGQKLNLYVPKQVKQMAYKMATNQRKSMSAVVTDLVLEANKKPV